MGSASLEEAPCHCPEPRCRWFCSAARAPARFQLPIGWVERYKLCDLPRAHYDGRHTDPEDTDILVAAKNSGPGAPTLVYVYKGCDWQFLI